MRHLLWPAALVILLQGCSAADGGSPPGSNPPASPTPTPGATSQSMVPTRIVDEILADAAKRAAVDPKSVAVVSAELRTWGDGSLGCPQPGMYYTQVQVDGYQVVVSAGGKQYDYRAGAGRFRLCEDNPQRS
jgi:hypothetical protein